MKTRKRKGKVPARTEKDKFYVKREQYRLQILKGRLFVNGVETESLVDHDDRTASIADPGERLEVIYRAVRAGVGAAIRDYPALEHEHVPRDSQQPGVADGLGLVIVGGRRLRVDISESDGGALPWRMDYDRGLITIFDWRCSLVRLAARAATAGVNVVEIVAALQEYRAQREGK